MTITVILLFSSVALHSGHIIFISCKENIRNVFRLSWLIHLLSCVLLFVCLCVWLPRTILKVSPLKVAPGAKKTSIVILCALVRGMLCTKPNHRSKWWQDEVELSKRMARGRVLGLGAELTAHLLHYKRGAMHFPCVQDPNVWLKYIHLNWVRKITSTSETNM